MNDPRQFEELVLQTEGVLRTYIAGMGVGRHAVDDIAQETYLAIWTQGLPEGIEPARWLKGIARKKAVDYIRLAAPRRRMVAELAAAAVSDADQGDQPTLGALRQCLKRLPDADSDLLRRYYQDDESGDAIARAIGVDGSSVRKHLIRLRGSLERCIALRLKTEGA
jgi:RNA polymerase sigma-70 factor (ECF subfamily)